MTEGITLEDIIETIIESRRMLFAFFAIAIVMAYFFYWTSPKMYTAEATILPFTSGGVGLADYLAGTGLGMLTNSETKANVILVAINSQTLAENVLNKFNIVSFIRNTPKEKLKPNDLEKAAYTLKESIIKSALKELGCR